MSELVLKARWAATERKDNYGLSLQLNHYLRDGRVDHRLEHVGLAAVQVLQVAWPEAVVAADKQNWNGFYWVFDRLTTMREYEGPRGLTAAVSPGFILINFNPTSGVLGFAYDRDNTPLVGLAIRTLRRYFREFGTFEGIA